MAVRIVKIFKPVEIQHEKSQRVFIAVRPLYFSFQLSVKMPGIIKLSEVVDDAQLQVSMFTIL